MDGEGEEWVCLYAGACAGVDCDWVGFGCQPAGDGAVESPPQEAGRRNDEQGQHDEGVGQADRPVDLDDHRIDDTPVLPGVMGIELFATQGYDGTSLRQIADAVGIKEPGLYNHFASKQSLYEAVLHRALNPMTEALSRQLEEATGLRDYTDLPSIMTDLLAGRVRLDAFRGVVFVGGFSYADVLDSAKGWAGVIRFHDEIASQFDEFYARTDTFSLGVCNGCQLSALLGWVPWPGIGMTEQPRFIRNASGRFESRFVGARIEPSPSILLRGMEGARLGIWSVHGEGRAFFPEPGILERVEAEGLAPVRFVDDQGLPTERYPFNPNGSAQGIAALCSPDGRHLAIMPHPERAFRLWQWPWLPADLKTAMQAAAVHGEAAPSPWFRMFTNAREWCDETR